jgi:hypothetical protein
MSKRSWRPNWIITMLGFLVFATGAAYHLGQPPVYPGLACDGERVHTFGWTSAEKSRAELAAILRWKQITRQQGAAYGEWHNARRRFLKCRVIGGPGGQYQCRIAALPCRRIKQAQVH